MQNKYHKHNSNILPRKTQDFYDQCAFPDTQILFFINKTMEFFLHLAQQPIA